MSLLEDTLKKIQPPDEAVINSITDEISRGIPDGAGMGALGELLIKYAAITGETRPVPPKKCTIICSADHGVAAENVSAYPQSTTLQMTANYLIPKGGTANALSNFCESELLVADLGINADTSHIPGLIRRKIAFGTGNIAKEPAMTREEAVLSIETGIELASKCAEDGCRVFLPGEMGIANTTSSACIAAVLTGLTPEEATGRGTNISDERLKVKIDVVRRAIKTNRPNPEDGIDVLAKVGGFETGCIAGIILGAAASHAFVVLDGFNTGAAALIAQSLSPLVSHYLMGSHLAAEPAHRAMLKKLGVRHYMDMKFRLGEATGSSIAADLLDAAVAAYDALTGEEGEDDFFHETMPPRAEPITDRTFEFYLHTFPQLAKPAMEACQLRLDNLTKPIYCLGYLEEIAKELAGIRDDDRPPLDMERALICFSSAEVSKAQRRLTAAFAAHAGAEVTAVRIRRDRPLTEAFDFGRMIAEGISFSTPIVALSLSESDPDDEFGTLAKAFRETLLDDDGSLRYDAASFLGHVPPKARADAAAMLGALIAAAHNRAMVVMDDEATEIIARYAEALCPEVKPFVLHIQPALLTLGMTVPGGCVASLGLRMIDASLHILNDMKTFAEANVPVAGDGPGHGRQIGAE